jgi:wyosine [tRNA(Phe)-imidazoG37] synthetase (radical SAM superfamily)
MYKYLRGPISSRRLGVSLGLYIIPHKICSMDCIYCEAGATTELTVKRKRYMGFAELIYELDEFLADRPKLDYITIAGTGEPTLNKNTGNIIKHIKATYPSYKLALITNSSIFIDIKTHNEFLDCDLIVPSLDAVSDDAFQIINRPYTTIRSESIIEGLISFRAKYHHQMWLEIFFVEGINDTPAELEKLKDACISIKPDMIHLNSLDRSGVVDWIKKVPNDKMNEIARYFHPLPVQIV